MQDIRNTIEEYEATHKKLEASLKALDKGIQKASFNRQGSALFEKRKIIRDMLLDVEAGLYRMREYIQMTQNK